MKRAYSRLYHPPAPVVPVGIRVPTSERRLELDGKIDTGADVCGIPQAVVAVLDLAPYRTTRVAAFMTLPRDVDLYRLDFELAGRRFERLEAVATLRPYVTLGRNLLRHLVLRLDGPHERLELRVARRG